MLDDLKELLFPVVDLIAKKIEQMESLQEHQENIKEMQNRWKKPKTLDEAKLIEEELAKLVEVEFKPLALQTRLTNLDTSGPAALRTSGSQSQNKQGGFNHFRCYYTCQSGGEGNECLTLILSKLWARRHADPLASQQRYKCTWCSAEYKSWMGVVIEIKKNEVLYCF